MAAITHAGRVLTLETGAFFFVTIFVVTFAPQFGHSRLFMYLVLVVYGVLEGVVRGQCYGGPCAKDARGVCVKLSVDLKIGQSFIMSLLMQSLTSIAVVHG